MCYHWLQYSLAAGSFFGSLLALRATLVQSNKLNSPQTLPSILISIFAFLFLSRFLELDLFLIIGLNTTHPVQSFDWLLFQMQVCHWPICTQQGDIVHIG